MRSQAVMEAAAGYTSSERGDIGYSLSRHVLAAAQGNCETMRRGRSPRLGDVDHQPSLRPAPGGICRPLVEGAYGSQAPDLLAFQTGAVPGPGFSGKWKQPILNALRRRDPNRQ